MQGPHRSMNVVVVRQLANYYGSNHPAFFWSYLLSHILDFSLKILSFVNITYCFSLTCCLQSSFSRSRCSWAALVSPAYWGVWRVESAFGDCPVMWCMVHCCRTAIQTVQYSTPNHMFGALGYLLSCRAVLNISVRCKVQIKVQRDQISGVRAACLGHSFHA